jgi:nucleoside-diphosphate-sugar epimerase
LARRSPGPLTLYARQGEGLARLVEAFAGSAVDCAEITSFPRQAHDVIINAVGRGDPRQVREIGKDILPLTADWDRAVIECLGDNSEALYVAISSGAVYGARLEAPVDGSTAMISLETARALGDHYTVSKLLAEAGHRALAGRNIVDLRLFGYVSPYLNQEGGFFLSQVFKALTSGTVLQTWPSNMVRDFISPRDLADLIELCAAARPLNRAFDVSSAKPVFKFELLEAMNQTFGFEWRITEDPELSAGAVEKLIYYSLNNQAATLGYAPERSALDNVMAAFAARLEDWPGLRGREKSRHAG